MTKVLCMILVVSLAFSSLMITIPVNSGEVTPTVSAQIPSAPIRIDKDADFLGDASSGDGSFSNPWVIQDLSINGTGSGSCIYIGNTTQHFVVRNCTLYNASGGDGSPFWMDASVMLFNVENGTLHNNTLNNSMYGIYLYNNSANNTITWNNISQNRDTGMIMELNSYNNIISNNTISYNGLIGTNFFSGICAFSGTSNNITDNSVYNNSRYGILLSSASKNKISNCSVYNNTIAGVILFSASNNNNITNCRLDNNAFGIFIKASNNNNFAYHNNFINNTIQAIDNGTNNNWDKGYPAGGNYWDDYSGIDIMNGPSQNIAGSDGIGDMPYTNIVGSAGANDSFPLMNPYNSSVQSGTLHAPVRINNNADFVGLGLSGSGALGDPWIIENWNIDGNGKESCIYVGNTTEYFIIRNCSVYGASTIYKNPPQNASILCFNVTNGKLVNNTANDSANGIVLYNSSCEILQNNVFGNEDCGIQVYGSNNWSAINNTIYNNNVGLNVTDLDFWMNHTIYHNNFINNTAHQAIDILGAQPWDSGYPGGGNFWSDYTGGDQFNGPNQNWNGSDGIGDIPYPIDGVTGDGYPLMEPYTGQTFGETVLPYAVSWIPIGASIPLSSTFQIHWNESMNWTLVESEFSYTDGSQTWNSSNGNWSHSTITFNSTFTPDHLAHNTTYWITMGCNVTDFIGNYLDQNHNGISGEWPDDVLIWNFTTDVQDLIAPYALNYSPNGTNAPVNSPIIINWSETMNWTSINQNFSYTDGIVNWTSADGTWNHSSTTNISTFIPNADFVYETKYFVTINCNATDKNGNPLDQNMSGTGGEWPSDILAWNFTVTDQAPSVISTVPANDQIDVDPYKPIKIVFSEAMNRSSVEAGFSYTNGTQTWDLNDGVVYWNAFQTEFTFSHVLSLELNQTFTANLNGSMARDAGGKLLAGGNYSWSFTTWLEPPAPHVIDTYPPAGAINVNVNTYINIGFDSEMTISSLDGAFSYTDGTDVWDVADGMVDWFSDNTLFSFQPTEKLNYDSTYTVRIKSNATSIYDKHLDGNDNGIPDANDDYVFVFTTTPEPPVVESHYPEANQMGVPITLPAVYINFTKIMNQISVTNAVSIYPNTAFTPSFSGGGDNLALVLTGELLVGTQYRVTILGTAMDLSGIKLDGNNDGWAGDKFTFSFSTAIPEEPVKPQIVSIFPQNNATIPIEPFYVMVTFNVIMNRTSVQDAFKFKNETDYLNGTYEWSVSGKAFRFMPDTVLEYNMTYFASLQGTATDVNGVPLGNSTNWQYVTEAAPATTSYGDWIMYGIIIFLAVMVIILYMANRSLRKDLKRTRVKLKRLKREMGVENKPTEPEKLPEGDEIIDEELPDEPTEELQPETEEIIEE